MAHEHMTHSSMVVDGHGKIPEGKYNFWEPKNKEQGYHPYIQKSAIWSVQMSTCQVYGTDSRELITMIQDPGAWLRFSIELKEVLIQ